jgi:predicted small metal-binding protein
MKSMTCKQLGGACGHVLRANSFDEIAMLASKHGREMVGNGDQAHIEAMNEMRQQMTSPEAVRAWMADKKAIFESLTED